MRWLALVSIGCLGLLGAVASATDQPIGASSLLLKRTPTRGVLKFQSKDPAVLFPVPESLDDPRTGLPGGAQIELFSRNDPTPALLDAERGGFHQPSDPSGWWAGAGWYRFRGRTVTVKAVFLRQGKGIKVTARSAGLALAGAQGSVGIRITTGTLRSCALFTPDTVVRDVAGQFRAKNAVATALADCDDRTLQGVPACGVSEFPACGGVCPAGQECQHFDYTGLCGCIPAGSTPCNAVCGGACPVDQTCTDLVLPLGGYTCQCVSGF